MSISTGPWSNERKWPGLMTRFLVHHVDGLMRVRCLRKEDKSAQVGLLKAETCLETFVPYINLDVTLTHTTLPQIVADQLHLFMTSVFPVGSGPFSRTGMFLKCSGMVG